MEDGHLGPLRSLFDRWFCRLGPFVLNLVLIGLFGPLRRGRFSFPGQGIGRMALFMVMG